MFRYVLFIFLIMITHLFWDLKTAARKLGLTKHLYYYSRKLINGHLHLPA
jgi:hypothetical protein